MPKKRGSKPDQYQLHQDIETGDCITFGKTPKIGLTLELEENALKFIRKILMHRGQKIDRKVNKGNHFAHQNIVQSKLVTKVHPPCLPGTWMHKQ